MTRPQRTEGVCEQTLSGVAAYLDGDLEADACAAIERHCHACAPCARFVSGLRETMGLCHDAATRPLPDDVRERARARIDRLLAGADPTR